MKYNFDIFNLFKVPYVNGKFADSGGYTGRD